LLLLSFHQMGMAQGVILTRLLDTVVGCLIAAGAAWLVLPHWQSRQWPLLAARALQTQAIYLREILTQYQSGKCDHLAYRLARRNAHNADAALSNSYSAMLKEPQRVRGNADVVANFLCLSHTQLNYLSALGAQRGSTAAQPLDDATQATAQSLLAALLRLAHELEHAQQQHSKKSRRQTGVAHATAVERVRRNITRPTRQTRSPASHSWTVAQLRLVARVMVQLQELARQMVGRKDAGVVGQV
jgi:uncharacterized membrane protein YccC